MTTSAVFIFMDAASEYHVYKHSDSYPYTGGGFAAIAKAVKLSWEPRRFDAGEFAAAFVAANKTGEGEVQLVNEDTCPVIDYIYYITYDNRPDNFTVKVACHDANAKTSKAMFSASLDVVATGWQPDWPVPA